MLCSATTSLVALNYKIPVTDSEDTPNCNVTARSQRAEPLHAATLHVWDEFPMAHPHLFLHSLKSTGMPDHNLKLKLNCLCLVMRNISVQDRVMNNTKVILREVGRKYVTVETLLEHRQVPLSLITFRFTLPRSGVTVERRQFLLHPCYAITVNKSQGQTLRRICYDVREHPFAHGQLVSCVRNRQDILMLTRPSHLLDGKALTKNVVYPELLPSSAWG